MDNLIFFDKDGNPLNFNWNQSLERWEGDIMFHPNSNDTYKTQAIYTFEKVNSFEFESREPEEKNLSLRKFQLFNEFGFHFYESKFQNQKIDYLEPTNLESSYYSKWIYGVDFHRKFPLGTLIRFEDPLFEFISKDIVYAVTSVKKGAILIISSVDNKTFNSTYNFKNLSNYTGKKISAVNSIGIYNYIDPTDFRDTLSSWNEPTFYNRLYKRRKLNVVNTQKNDDFSKTLNPDDVSIFTLENVNILDLAHFEFSTSPFEGNITIEVKNKTDLPLIYIGSISLRNESNPLDISGVTWSNVMVLDDVPSVLKPGIKFKIPESTQNVQFLTVGNINSFLNNVNLKEYKVGEQVIWENKIYQCLQTYTWSVVTDITPNQSEYWTRNITYLPIAGNFSPESLLSGTIYLTTDTFYFTQTYTQSGAITLASAAQNFTTDLSFLNIDLFYDNSLQAHLIYPSLYSEVTFYGWTNSFSPTSSVNLTNRKKTYERILEVEESVSKEFNYDLSENFEYNIVFTDLDEFGLKISINGQLYDIETQFRYSSGIIDLERTIDATLREWLFTWNVKFYTLGLIINLQTVGTGSPYYNSLKIKTQFPNVPLQFKVSVGTTADFYIEKYILQFYQPSEIGVFPSLGTYINIIVNDRSYPIERNLTDPVSNLIEGWIEEWSDILQSFDIFVIASGNSIRFNVKEQNKRLDISVQTGISVLPGDANWKLVKRSFGNLGSLITSNEIILGTYSSDSSFEDVGFSTGMITGINGTPFNLQNVEYNIIFLDPNVMNLTYEGPFWGMTSSICDGSPYTVVSFDIGFSQSICGESIPDYGGGSFNSSQFGFDFNIFKGVTNYQIFEYDGFVGMVDLVYVQLSDSFFVLGEEKILVLNSDSTFIKYIDLPGNSSSQQIIYNDVDGFVYSLSQNLFWKIDPFSNNIVGTSSITGGFSLSYNTNNGQVYVSTSSSLLVFESTNLVQSISTTTWNGSFYSVFNKFENLLYLSTRNGSTLLRINPTTFAITNLTVSGLTQSDLIYNPINESVWTWGDVLSIVDNNNVAPITGSTAGSFSTLLFNNLSEGVNISTDKEISLFDSEGNYIWKHQHSGIWGYLALNQYDGDIYLSNQNPLSPGIWIIDSGDGFIKESFILSLSQSTTKIIYNPSRGSVWALQPSERSIIEVKPTLNINFTPSEEVITSTGSNLFGALSSDYNKKNYLWLNTRDFIRKPRNNFNGEPRTSLYWKWFSDNVPEMFIYDFSGNSLPTTGLLAYTGPKPLPTVHLNRNPNRDISKKSDPTSQQTIFPFIEESLSYIDDEDDISVLPEPFELFLGFNSQIEGPIRSIIQLFQKEPIDFTIRSLVDVTDVITIETIINQTTEEKFGSIRLDVLSNSNFITDNQGNPRGLKSGQYLAIFVKDETNTRKQYISSNNGYLVKIREVFFRELVVDFFKSVDSFTTEKNIIENYPKPGQKTFLSFRFKVWDKEIGRFNVFGQTEIEDIRFKIELGNVGKLVSSDDVYIFKEYDIKEEGIDWNYLNAKRKEMLIMKNMIYPYIGSYKSIINAINYFGYNDLELYEYYRNINLDSKNFLKLFKVEIPDIFDNTVEGWTDNDFIKGTFPNPNYEETNLFNLTYRITDKEGNNVLTYTLEEVQKKLQGLKYWLQKNIIPITHKILDITGRADFVGVHTISHSVKDIQIVKIKEDFTPITFKMNELYLMPVNNGSTVYNCVLDFYLSTTHSTPDYFFIDIATYETYREWFPFTEYKQGDKVIYFDKIWESAIDNNKTNNPRKYENVTDWSSNTVYNVSDVTKYIRDYYIYTGFGNGFTQSISGEFITVATSSSIPPINDTQNWLNITEWRESDLVPIQHIKEWRNINNLKPFNFTIDSNIDPFLSIKVSSDNGRGSVWTEKKNYEVRGILDVRESEAYKNLISKN